ncbi:MAG: SIMPL domain-containing protein [Firmicutes bacterium]|nr:SIMPL domain-containing protein [Bacillota bacterium]
MGEYKKVAAILGASIVMASLVFGLFFFHSRKPNQTITVVGTASKQYESDTVKFSITITETSGLDDMADGRRRLYGSLRELIDFLGVEGIPETQISIIPSNVYERWGQSGIEGYRYEQEIYVISKDIDTVEYLALNVIPLLERDINVYRTRLEYFYSDLDELKKNMVAEATENAKQRAYEMLRGSDMELGKLQTLRQGVFQITQPESTEVSSGGIHDTSTRQKQISVTAHAVFKIK